MKKTSKASRLLELAPHKAGRAVLRLRGFTSSYIQTPVAAHHVYTLQGQGTLGHLVFCHGGSDGALSFAPVMLRLRKYASKITAVEVAGHGLSEDPKETYTFANHYAAMNHMLDTLIDESEPAAIVGNSLGGLTALHFAARYPKKVRGLFLMSPVGAPMTSEQLEELRVAFNPANARQTRLFVERVYHKLPKAQAGLISRMALAQLRRPAIAALVQATSLTDTIAPEDLKKLHMPVQIIHGTSDRILPSDAAEYFRAYMPGATVIRAKDMGHSPHFEQPKRVAAMVLDFLKTL